MDGEEFISSVVKSDFLERLHSTPQADGSTCHIVMNLPSLAVDFLKFLRSLLSDRELPTERNIAALLPMIHCYTFSRADDPAADAAERTAAALGVSFEELQGSSVRNVRAVAPGKEMLCVTFRLPLHVLVATDSQGTSRSFA